MIKKSLFLCAFLYGANAHAQMVSGSAYLQGNFVEIGVDSLGGHEGVKMPVCPPPPGMHPRSGGTNLFGFVANPQMDGWVNFDGDFYSPGSPENGWGIEIIDTTTTDTFNLKLANNATAGFIGIPGSVTSYSNVAGHITVTWHGDVLGSGYDLDFDLTYELYSTDLFYTTTMTIFNNGPANIEDLYYYRNIDPDNNQPISGDFTTTNTIMSQPSSSSSVASVKAVQTAPWTSTFAFFANDTTARVCKGGFSNRDGSDMYNGVGGLDGTVGASSIADEAVSLVFHQPGLVSFTRAGTSSVTFSFKTVFDGTALDSLITTAEHMGVDEVNIEGLNVYPNPANQVLNVTANEQLKTLTIYNALGTVVYNNSNANTTNLQIDMSVLNSGFYFLSIEGANGKVVKKIMKQ